MLDAASKSFAATGLRVGWAVMPPAARQRMADILGHVGAWAPKAEQVAMAALLDDEAAIDAYHARCARACASASTRSPPASRRCARDGLPVEVIAPQGAIYLSVRFALPGRTQRADAQACCSTRRASPLVPFQAFGLARTAAGSASRSAPSRWPEIDAALPRVRAALAPG